MTSLKNMTTVMQISVVLSTFASEIRYPVRLSTEKTLLTLTVALEINLF